MSTGTNQRTRPKRPRVKHRYPADWAIISAAVRKRANGRCQCRGFCGHHLGYRCREIDRQKSEWQKGKVFLQAAHLCQNEPCRNMAHLIATCQACHLRYDVNQHVFNAKVTARGGQLHLFESMPPPKRGPVLDTPCET